ncbi:cytochrome-c oxidase, cbb3-type subunit III [Psychrobacter sanguinis]|uniref:cytochrome-c oxidase, cbb3-type subunit III n=1 Tax=Psychrobacter sanguinis TaxID=861445 RepID=UPI00020C98A3|nr:cytochrome-c oxidase, cbb3-type subunit III [Psychrobacter sanguinis]EGK09994.1 cytochrome c oxidase Cbb3-type [Psychrobacter sp. 1501(2011)]MCD9152493.1 cytochrome-c oxidase, cbb3-type subunit III [Psychrobacter sanguinis]
MSIFWSSWITILSIGCWLFILGALLYVVRPGSSPELEEDGTTGHTYDDVIQEYDKPLPKWWLAIFFGSVLWALGYWLLFPALFPSHFNGLSTVEVDGKTVPWSSKNELYSDLEENNKIFTENFNTNFLPNPAAQKQLATLASLQAKEPVKSERSSELNEQLKTNITALAPYVKELSGNQKAVMAGERLFLQNCAVCHGSTAQGAPGYPNLTDNDWLHGGKPENILLTLHNGWHVNLDPAQPLPMPAQRDDIGEQGVRAAAEYVLSISKNQEKSELDPAKVAQGKAIFNEKCFICHGSDAKGSIDAGAPNLTDGIWLYGGDRETIQETIRHGRGGVMPQWETKLGNERIMLLASYVYSLSNNPVVSNAPTEASAK